MSPPRRFTDEQEKEIVNVYLSGVSTREISRRMNLPGKDAIIGALRRQGIQQRNPSERNRLYTLDEYAFDLITPEVAYWWGFLYADGCISKRTLVVALKWDDVSHLDKLKSFMKSESPIKKYIRKVNGTTHYVCHIEFTSQYLVDRLRSLGILLHRTNFGLVINNLPEDMIRYWILGFFDGDGTIYGKLNKQFCIGFMGSLEVMVWIREHLPFVNKSKRIYKHIISNVYYLTFSGNNICRTVAEYLYSNQNLYMDRKFNKSQYIPITHIRKRDSFGRYCN
jgi:hypothetical protein